MSPQFIEAILDGRRSEARELAGFDFPGGWPRGDERFLALRLEQMRKDPAVQQWLVRAMVLPETRQMVGHCGFHGPPGINGPEDPDAVEVGYTVLLPQRRRGYASEAVLAMIEWASTEHGIKRFIASISPSNHPSIGLVTKLGFRQTGTQWDEEDGEELVFTLEKPATDKSR
jgi:ribosomal-protein-alanine N-acetyltransferase